MLLIMKKLSAFTIILALSFCAFSQEALKSTEEEYYDFLSLMGITERPSLNYRTLSDSVWEIKDAENDFFEADGTENNVNPENTEATEAANKKHKAAEAAKVGKTAHPWQNNNLGTKKILWKQNSEKTNWFLKGINRSAALKIYGPEWFNSYNTAAPYGQNDGALWQGKGYNTSLTAGARLEGYGFELTLKPQLSFSQNLGFDFMPGVFGSEYSYFWQGNIDLVQRYGDSSFWTFDWGDTEIRWSWHTLTAGFGFQSPWLGPAWLNPMLGSNNAGTYPKFDIGLRRTKIHLPWLGWYIGDIEGRIWCGKLSESEYFDNDSSNDYRMINGISIAYAPAFLQGFTIGINRIFLTQWKSKNLKYLWRLFTIEHSNDIDGDGEDQKVSIFVNWLLNKIGFEFFGEFGLDDFTSQKTANPFHTAIYTIGVKQYIPLCFNKFNRNFPNLGSELIFEWNNFEMSQDFQLQWAYMGYYSHGKIKQGYTQNGQILGAGSGYAGNSQFLGYKIYFSKGFLMPFFHRSSPDNNYIYSKAVNTDASYDASQKGENNLNKEYWAIFKTFKEIGCSFEYFITDSLHFNGSFSYIWINFPKYNKKEIGENSCHITLGVKYNI